MKKTDLISCVKEDNVKYISLSTTERKSMQIQELPASLSEAMQELARDDVLKQALGPVAYEVFYRAKQTEIEESQLKVTDWEVMRYLED